jgi:hypothetical protein
MSELSSPPITLAVLGVEHSYNFLYCVSYLFQPISSFVACFKCVIQPDGQAGKVRIRALSTASAVISPGRWQHFLLWPLFLQRDKGKRTEMTGTQHVGT